MVRTALVAATLALLSGHAFADTAPPADECGETELSDEALAAINHAEDNEDAKTDEADAQYHVPVHLHIVRKAPQGEGDMPVAHAREITIDVLNREFAAQDIPFTFDLSSIDYMNGSDAEYHLAQSSDDEKRLYDALNKGGRRDLNIYIVGPDPSTTVTGWAEFLINPALLRGDHAVLRYYPAKGGFSDPLVPVHEVGHWLGLLHTFQFGCGQLRHGDLIRDTPTQKQAVFTCAADTDTCPDDPGLDPVDNIMGYSHSCRSVFTPGQQKRMKFLWRTARGGKGDDLVIPDDSVPADDDAGGCAAAGSSGGVGFALLALAGATRRRRRS